MHRLFRSLRLDESFFQGDILLYTRLGPGNPGYGKIGLDGATSLEDA